MFLTLKIHLFKQMTYLGLQVKERILLLLESYGETDEYDKVDKNEVAKHARHRCVEIHCEDDEGVCQKD